MRICEQSRAVGAGICRREYDLGGCDRRPAWIVYVAGTTMTDKIERVIDETRGFLAERASPDVRAAVMYRIQHLEPVAAITPPGRVKRLAQALWTPRAVSIRPAFAYAAAAVVVTLLVMPYTRPVPAPDQQVMNESADARVFVRFHLDAAAMRVQLAGSFTDWQPRYDLRQSTPGVWTITVPLTQGVHDYAFVVDGEQWVPDPHAPQIGDGFGGMNSRLALLHADTPAL